jgi:ribosome silencing factor RsfS/YbeB/iojap
MEESDMEAPIDTVKLATALAQAAADTKASDIVILDMRGLVYYTDMFVLCSGRSGRQVSAIADAMRAVAKNDFGVLPLGVEGKETAKWVLVDLGDVVVHVFEESMRGFYNLDGLWADAPRLEAPEGEEPAEPRFFTP